MTAQYQQVDTVHNVPFSRQESKQCSSPICIVKLALGSDLELCQQLRHL